MNEKSKLFDTSDPNNQRGPIVVSLVITVVVIIVNLFMAKYHS